MIERIDINEQQTAEAFGRQSAVFDDIYSPNLTIQYKRERVRNHVLKYLKPNSNILELNAGTGEDAMYFAGLGHQVHATDLSGGMLDKLKIKVQQHGLQDKISSEQCSFNELDKLKARGPYDLIFSNFGGLNCTGKLNNVLNSFDTLLKPGGLVTLVIISPFCLWETMLALRGNFKAAFRRLNSRDGSPAHIEGIEFTCWYYKQSYIINTLSSYRHLSTEGLCTIVPPSYFEGFPHKRPKLFAKLKNWEEKYKSKWPWRNIGDYYIITLQKPL
jgi:ubiquinone/menaquinone biosynthesis C-methylase UbiE